MTDRRLTIAYAITILLLSLFVFTQYRWSLVDTCHRRGGVWDGADGKCRLIPARLFIDEENQRT